MTAHVLTFAAGLILGAWLWNKYRGVAIAQIEIEKDIAVAEYSVLLRGARAELEALKANDASLADPKSERKPSELTPSYALNQARSIKPEIFVAVGICTHLGCSPSDKFQTGAQASLPDDWNGGFLCPCHGSTFDMAGRVYKNKPAPDNLEIPPHMYLSDTKLLIGEDKKA